MIFVSLRTAASAEAPSSPMLLPPMLQGMGVGAQSEGRCVSAPADTNANTLHGAAAHSRWVIRVSLRTAASVEAPLSPILLCLRLRTRGGAKMVGE